MNPAPRLCGEPATTYPALQIHRQMAPVVGRVRQWLLDTGNIYQTTSARFPDPSTQRRLAARAEEIGKRWPDFPATCRRVVLIALIDRVDVCVDRIEIRLSPPRLSALLDVAATPLQCVRRAGREIRMLIDGVVPIPDLTPRVW
jgi:hypothetical protein